MKLKLTREFGAVRSLLGRIMRAPDAVPGLLVLSLLALACGTSPDVQARPDETRQPFMSTPSAANEPAERTTPSPTSPPTRCAATGSEDELLLLTVDKRHALPATFAPADLVQLENSWVVDGFEGVTLRAVAADALGELLAAGASAGHDLRVRSGFRSYSEQEGTFEFWVAQLGEEQAERESARAGYSEHQLGTTVDVTTQEVGWELIQQFGTTAAGEWLAENAHLYGFALSYRTQDEEVTGYVWEPWHIRYVGVACATEWKASDLALVDFLEVTNVR